MNLVCCQSRNIRNVAISARQFSSQFTTDPFVRTLFSQLIQGERSALARSITLVESKHPGKRKQAESLLNLALSQLKSPRSHRHHHALHEAGSDQVEPQNLQDSTQEEPWLGGCFRVGFTGPPGAGKSTLLEALCAQLTEKGLRVAVLAVDPSSARSGGSLLGDKTRMPELSKNQLAYVRPSPTAGAPGGVARGTSEAAVLCEAAGYDLLFVETVGVGQSEVAVADLVDCCCLLLPPAAGDELQGIKKGVVEMADMVVVTKCDGALAADARRVAADYTSALKFVRPRTRSWRPSVLTLSALKNKGLQELWHSMLSFRSSMMQSGELTERRQEQRQAWLWRLLRQKLLEDFLECQAVREQLPQIEQRVLEGSLTPGAGADHLLEIFEHPKSS